MQRIFHDVKQNTDEWYKLKMGKITSSNFGKIMANCIKKNEFIPNAIFGDPAIECAREIAHEIKTGRKYENKFTSPIFDRGHEYEPIARRLYENETFYKVTNGGFYELGNYGDSSDGKIGNIGCIEIKTAIEKVHWHLIEKGGYDLSYKWQIQGHIWIGNKQWCDFIRFCPEFYEPKRLYIYRVYRDDIMINQLKSRLSEFWNEVNNKLKYLE